MQEGSSDIGKAISKRTSGSNSKKDSLESQVEAAIYYGEIRPDAEFADDSQPKKRGRPPNKSKSPGPSKSAEGAPPTFKTKDPTKNNVDKALEEIKRNVLVSKLRAYAQYWPEVCGPALTSLNIHRCTPEQLKELCDTFESSVQTYSEIIDIPMNLKNMLCAIEPMAMSVGMANPSDPFLRQGVLLHGLTDEIMKDPKIDHNIKLIAIRFIGRTPKNPFFNLLISLAVVVFRCYKTNIVKMKFKESVVPEEENENYKDL